MNTELRDVIEMEIVISAPKAQVYSAIAETEQIVKWFPEGIEGSLTPGQEPILDFGEYGRHRIYVENAKPTDYFAFRWIPGSVKSAGFLDDVRTQPNTLVEFSLSEIQGGTLVKLKESGFASLPPEYYEKSINDNTGGWEYMMDRLTKYLA